MKNIKYFMLVLIAIGFTSCEQDTYEFGTLTSPSELTVAADVVVKLLQILMVMEPEL
mgnify:CR=1 FL=1